MPNRQPVNRTATRRQLTPLSGHLAAIHGAHSRVTDAEGPMHALRTLGELHQTTANATRAAVDAARAAGHSWSEIAGVLDVSKQAAQQRYGAAPSSRVD